MAWTTRHERRGTMAKHVTTTREVSARMAAGAALAGIFGVALMVTAIATSASTLAWVPGRTETGIAALQNSAAPVTALAEANGGGPLSAPTGGGAPAGHMT